MFRRQFDNDRSEIDFGDGVKADLQVVQLFTRAQYIEVFDINPNYIAVFKARNIGPIYIRIIDLTFLYFGYKDLYLDD